MMSVRKQKKSFSQSSLPLFFYEDVNECRQNVCRPDQHCKNTRGGYKCIDLCPNGMTKAENGTCIGECMAVWTTEIHLPLTCQVRRPFLKLMIKVNLISQGNFSFLTGFLLPGSSVFELWGPRLYTKTVEAYHFELPSIITLLLYSLIST